MPSLSLQLRYHYFKLTGFSISFIERSFAVNINPTGLAPGHHYAEVCKHSERPSNHAVMFCATGVENVSDHETIGPSKFLGLPENILSFRSKKRVIGQT